MASTDELACVYSALILADDEVAITADKIQTLLKAANVSVEPFWPSLFAKALGAVNVVDLIANLSSGAGASPSAGGAAPSAGGGGGGGGGGAEPAKAEEKKEEKKEESEESDDDMGFGLFD